MTQEIKVVATKEKAKEAAQALRLELKSKGLNRTKASVSVGGGIVTNEYYLILSPYWKQGTNDYSNLTAEDANLIYEVSRQGEFKGFSIHLTCQDILDEVIANTK